MEDFPSGHPAKYAPQARLVDVVTGKVIGSSTVRAELETELGRASAPTSVIEPDLISAKVTLTNTGVAQLQVTLNNQRLVNGLPAWPPWKYNDFWTKRVNLGSDGLGGIVFGQVIRLDLRYADSPWYKMIVAQVTDLQFSFPAAGGSQLQVVAEDLLSKLKVKPSADMPFNGKQEEAIVEEIVAAAFADATQRPAVTLVPGAAADEGRTQPLRSARLQKTSTYFQFVTDLCERLDYELYVDFVSVAADRSMASKTVVESIPSSLRLNFRRARSQPTAAERADWESNLESGERPHLVLRWGRDLIEFSPKIKVFDLPASAGGGGTTPGRRARQQATLTSAELNALLRKELVAAPNSSDVPMVTALDVREGSDTSGGNNDSAAGSGLDQPRLKLKAAAQFMKRSRECQTADAQIVGHPRLRPGNFVEVVGLRPPFDGYYYVTKTVHTLDAAGYKTQFSVRRPGMQGPDHYLPAPPASGGAS